ncbi:DUF2809 domain-containing protein [Paenibacillus sp. L3-i20]|uniref:ribosomal maturation YjgA family protein n=1 Tax=Paenibacillus sp. L3-i20 TaxID=2905833 RepID=UPI001EE09B75|nr:DUF2809 domain-containing protein [Paenibacillus sp. L3-i20]GKU78090.1 hypothetical protein L3i20_v224870 [Paenibacillus sp. L3-i20]
MITRARIFYVVAIIIMIVAGLCTRLWADNLPQFVAMHFGDALWAGMIYFGMRVIGISKKLGWAMMASTLFCLVIELSQLYQGEWINSVRDTVIGGLVLGHGFLMVDLVRYGAGILMVYLIDRYLLQHMFKIEKE